MSYPTRPPIVTGKDGLSHCGWCINEFHLCDFHRNQVGAELGHLVSASTLARAESDLRYIINKRPKNYANEDDEDVA